MVIGSLTDTTQEWFIKGIFLDKRLLKIFMD